MQHKLISGTFFSKELTVCCEPGPGAVYWVNLTVEKLKLSKLADSLRYFTVSKCARYLKNLSGDKSTYLVGIICPSFWNIYLPNFEEDKSQSPFTFRWLCFDSGLSCSRCPVIKTFRPWAQNRRQIELFSGSYRQFPSIPFDTVQFTVFQPGQFA